MVFFCLFCDVQIKKRAPRACIFLKKKYIQARSTRTYKERMGNAPSRPVKNIDCLPPEVQLIILEKLAEDGAAATAPIPWVCKRWHALFNWGCERKKFKRLRRRTACNAFIRLGSLPLLKWAREDHKIPLSAHTCSTAEKCGNQEIMRYVLKDCPWPHFHGMGTGSGDFWETFIALSMSILFVLFFVAITISVAGFLTFVPDM